MPDETAIRYDSLILETQKLIPSPTNPRKHYDAAKIEELGRSIASSGLIEPIIVRDHPTKAGRYEIVVGERRWRGAVSAKVGALPCIVRPLDDAQVLELQIVENLQREDVQPLDEAEGYRMLLEIGGYDVAEIAERIGKSTSYVYQRLKLAELSEEGKQALYDGEITAGHAVLIARLTPEGQEEALDRALDEYKPSVRELSDWIARELTRNLHSAIFTKSDSELLPEAGPCTTCPKRTGNVADLFPEIEKKDVCTDGACYKRKIEAHVARTIAELEAKGEKLVRLSSDWYEHPEEKGIYYRDHWYEATAKKKGGAGVCTSSVTGIIVRGRANVGRVFPVCVTKGCSVHFPKIGDGKEPSWRRDERKRAAAAHRESLVRQQIYHAIWAKGKPLTADRWKGGLDTAVRTLFELLSNEDQKLFFHLEDSGWKEKDQDHEATFEAYINGKSETGLRQVLVKLALAADVRASTWDRSKPEGLEKMGQMFGVDVAEIRRAAAKKRPVKKGAVKGFEK